MFPSLLCAAANQTAGAITQFSCAAAVPGSSRLFGANAKQKRIDVGANVGAESRRSATCLIDVLAASNEIDKGR